MQPACQTKGRAGVFLTATRRAIFLNGRLTMCCRERAKSFHRIRRCQAAKRNKYRMRKNLGVFVRLGNQLLSRPIILLDWRPGE
jgi:hypothetical protein